MSGSRKLKCEDDLAKAVVELKSEAKRIARQRGIELDQIVEEAFAVPRLISINEVADDLSVSRRTVERYIDAGRLARVDLSDGATSCVRVTRRSLLKLYSDGRKAKPRQGCIGRVAESDAKDRNRQSKPRSRRNRKTRERV